MLASIDSALEDIGKGKMIIVVDDEDRENEGDLFIPADFITPDVVSFMAMHGRGLICAPVESSIAENFGLTPMVQANTESKKTNFTVSIDLKVGTTTGISAVDRAKTIKALTNPLQDPQVFNRPGHIFPIIAKDGGVLVRAGHTEASIDLCKYAHCSAVGVICEIIKDNGEMARLPELITFAQKHNLKIISIEQLIAYRKSRETLIKREIEIPFSTDKYGEFTLIGYSNSIDTREHIALVKGDIESEKITPVRVHSECLTGDVFHSQRCDCHDQLHSALKYISEAKSGVLLYMRQEGRGIGLLNKLKAYKLQDEGYDTVDANTMLGFKSDLREYGIGAQILKDIGLQKIALMTNNPKKIVGLDGYGITIEKRIPIEIQPKVKNKKYLKTKKDKLGHLLNMV